MHAKEIEMCNGAWLWLHKTFDADDDNLIVMCVSLSRTELNNLNQFGIACIVLWEIFIINTVFASWI